MVIAKDTVVALRYIMRNSKEEVLENTMQSVPVNYLHGAKGILPLLQDQLTGLQAGDKKTIHLKKESGNTDDDFHFDVIIDAVRQAGQEEIELGYPVKITTEPCDDDCKCYT